MSDIDSTAPDSTFEDPFTDSRPERRVRGVQAPTLVLFGAQGGIGVTTLALTMAELAANDAGVPRVALIDARTGRSDVRSFLRLNERAPSFATADIQRDASRALITPDQVNSYRPSTVNDVSFGVAVPSTLEMGRMHKHALVNEVIRTVRYVSDLVIVDVGPVDVDANSTFTQVGLNLLQTGAWGVLVATMSIESSKVITSTLGGISKQLGVNRDKISTILNQVDEKYTDEQINNIRDRGILPLSTFAGVVGFDRKSVFDPMSVGQIPTKFVPMTSAAADIMQRATGRQAFEPIALASGASKKLLRKTQVDYDNQDRYDARDAKSSKAKQQVKVEPKRLFGRGK